MEAFENILKSPELLFPYIKEYAIKGTKETTKILLELYYVMISNSTSNVDKFLIGAAIAYQTIPKDLLPTSKLGLLGYFDNAAMLYFAYKKIKKSLTPEIENQVDSKLSKWFDGEEPRLVVVYDDELDKNEAKE